MVLLLQGLLRRLILPIKNSATKTMAPRRDESFATFYNTENTPLSSRHLIHHGMVEINAVPQYLGGTKAGMYPTVETSQQQKCFQHEKQAEFGNNNKKGMRSLRESVKKTKSFWPNCFKRRKP